MAAHSNDSLQPASSALSSYTVLDLSRLRAGPTCSRQLADWGADVIAVEVPLGAGDLAGGAREAGDFQNLHRNTRSISIDLKTRNGYEAFRRLAAKSDVVIENFRPDVKHRLRIAYEDLVEENPRLIYTSISAYGQTGPYSHRPGYDQIAQGIGGLMSITGAEGGGPMRAGIAIADSSAGIFAAVGTLVALLEREKSGVGQKVETSLLESQIFMLDFQAARWLIDGEVPRQAGNNHPLYIPTGVFTASDGYINIATTGQGMWTRLCASLEAGDLVDDERYATAAARLANRDQLNADLNKRLANRETAYWIQRLNEAGVPCGPIYEVDKMFTDPQVAHLQPAVAMRRKNRGALKVLRQPVALSRTPSSVVRPTPEHAEHTIEVLTEFGFSHDEIADLLLSKAVSQRGQS